VHIVYTVMYAGRDFVQYKNYTLTACEVVCLSAATANEGVCVCVCVPVLYREITCIFTSKCIKMRLAAGPSGTCRMILQRSPKPANWIKGRYVKGRDWKKVSERKVRGGERVRMGRNGCGGMNPVTA